MNQMLSIVSPMHNEEHGILEFISEIKRIVSPLGHDFEIVLVDDGSKDKTYEVAKSAAKDDKRIKLLKLSRNFGKEAALLAGLTYSQGDLIVMLDSDLQHPPELIPSMVAKFQEGIEVVKTIRTYTEKQSLQSTLASKMFYYIFNKLSYVPIHSGATDYLLISKRVKEVFCSMGEYDRFNRGLFSWIGFESFTFEYVAKERFAGETSFNLRLLIRLALSSITSFSGKPLRISFYVGLCTLGVLFLYLLYVVYDFFHHGTIRGWSSLFFSITMLGSVQLISIGVLGEYIYRIYNEVKRRPHYIVDEKSNL